MRLLTRLAALLALATLSILAGCGTKTPLKLPPPAQPVTVGAVTPGPTSAVPAAASKTAEPRQ